MNRTMRRGCVSVVMAIIAGAGTICCAQDNAEAAAPPMYEYKPARIALSTDQMAFQRSLIQKLIASVNSQTTLSDIETLTGRHFIVQVLDEDFLDDHRRFSSYVYDYPEGYRIDFQVFKTIPGASVTTDGFRLLLHVPDMRGIDVSECLSLADVSYFASRAGWDGLEPVHPSRIDLHGFAMERGGFVSKRVRAAMSWIVTLRASVVHPPVRASMTTTISDKFIRFRGASMTMAHRH